MDRFPEINVLQEETYWSRTLIELSDFSEFRESDKSLKYEFGSI